MVMIVPRPWQPGQVSSSPLVQEPDGGCWTQRSIHWPGFVEFQWSPFTVRVAVLRRKERGCGSCIVAPESALSSGGSSMGICVGCSSMVVGGRGEMLRVQSSQGAGAAFTGCWCCLADSRSQRAVERW